VIFDLKHRLLPQWRIVGLDTFASAPYPVRRCFTEAGARRAARRHLLRLEKDQPSDVSGGQAEGGIQDRVFIVRPDGSSYRFAGAGPPSDPGSPTGAL